MISSKALSLPSRGLVTSNFSSLSSRQAFKWTAPLLSRSRNHISPDNSNASALSRDIITRVFPFDQAWAPSASSIAPQLFAVSLFPYIGFLYHLTRSGKVVPRVTVIGFYFLLVFVGATIPAGIYGLHGSAESLLTITNLLIVLGLRQGIKEAIEQKGLNDNKSLDVKVEKEPVE